MPRCLASTARGSRCRLHACVGKEACHLHQNVNGDVLMTLQKTVVIPDKGQVIDVCAICLDDMHEKDKNKAVVRLAACGHVFHKKCLESWFNSNNLSCPNCRCDVEYDTFKKTMSTRRIDAYMLRVRFALAQLKSACKTRGRSLAHLGIDEQAVMSHMQLMNAICLKHVADEKLKNLERRVGELIGLLKG